MGHALGRPVLEPLADAVLAHTTRTDAQAATQPHERNEDGVTDGAAASPPDEDQDEA